MTDTVSATVPLDNVQHHFGTIRSTDPLTVESSPRQWEYAVSLRLELDRFAPQVVRLPVKVSATVTVDSGELGCLIVGDDWTTLLGRMPPDAGPGSHTIDVTWEHG